MWHISLGNLASAGRAKPDVYPGLINGASDRLRRLSRPPVLPHVQLTAIGGLCIACNADATAHMAVYQTHQTPYAHSGKTKESQNSGHPWPSLARLLDGVFSQPLTFSFVQIRRLLNLVLFFANAWLPK